jgi:hypothetical protein
MASIPIQITGVLTYSGLEVGGGPAPGGPPLGTWGGRPPAYVDIGLPGPQPPPLGTWGGRPPAYVDIGLPGPQPPGGPPPWVSHPIVPTPWPEPPVIGGGVPPSIWGGANQPFPTPPIVLPIAPGGALPEPGTLVEWKAGWSPQTGWVVVGLPQMPVPTPAARP